MVLDENLKEWRKGYFYFLKTGIAPLVLLESMIDSAKDFVLALYIFVAAIIEFITIPLWFFPVTYLVYRNFYKKLKKAYSENGIELNDSYQTQEDTDND
jgi:hypothetical protein